MIGKKESYGLTCSECGYSERLDSDLPYVSLDKIMKTCPRCNGRNLEVKKLEGVIEK